MNLTAFVLTLVALAVSDPSPIVGPTGGVPGDILILDASKAKAKSYAWGVDRDLPDKRMSILPLPPDNSRCIVCSVPGSYVVFCATATDKGDVQIYRWVVSVGTQPNPPGPPNPTPPTPTPVPVPVPVPVPPTPPPLPVGRFRLASFVATEANKLPAAAKVRAPVIGAAFGVLQARMVAGTLSATMVPSETKAAFNSAAGDHLTAWQAVSKTTQSRLQALTKEKDGIKTLADLADAYGELKIGLESVNP